ncbi:11790_t:CDS:2 [Ambispora gerdemannii]|uniref:11790_t:CDS:1 n=1 Tax=Ambispora gerdemannii TaxID=144530 RepID=A0A9N9FXX1_9GLOM|nr:11790_t:CDS:2 [Ambispora gerdemannii]
MSVSHISILLLGFFTASVFPCTPNNFDGNYIAIRLAGVVNNWRVNIAGGQIGENAKIITWNSGAQPAPNEIFMIIQPTRGVFELLPFLSFYREYAIGIPSSNINDTFTLQRRTNSSTQQFTFDCDTCDIQTNSQSWTQYHTSCNIKNSGYGFCMTGTDYSNAVNQTFCTAASKWDLWGRISPDIVNITNSKTPSNIQNSTFSWVSGTSAPAPNNVKESPGVQLSSGALVGIIVGSCAVTALIVLLVGYWFFRHRQKSIKNVDNVDGFDHANIQILNP